LAAHVRNSLESFGTPPLLNPQFQSSAQIAWRLLGRENGDAITLADNDIEMQ
jgi:hypothetical protein